MIPSRVLARGARAAVLVAALVVPAVLAQPAAASGQVQGIVTRGGGAPLPATSVASVGVKACSTPSTETCAEVAITSATTAGGYNLGLEAGDYDLWVVNLGNTRPLGGPFPVSVPEGGTAVLSPVIEVAIVQGTVTSGGVPFPPQTAGVGACNPNEPQGQSCPSLRAQFADGNGNYALALPPDDWTLRGFHNPGSSELSDENPTFNLGDGDVVTQNFNVPPPATVGGTVLDGSGDPFPAGSAGVGACPPSTIGLSCPFELKMAFADATGSYTLSLPPGTYRVAGFAFVGPSLIVGPAVTINVGAGQSLTEDFEVLFGTISGTVTDGVAPFPPGTAGASACPPPWSPGDPPLCPGLRLGFADANGDYSLLLEPGTYTISGFVVSGGEPIPTTAEVITIGDGDALVRHYTIGDTDGVPDEVEDDAPNGGDGNNDGTPDSEQPNVSSLPSAVTGNPYVTLAAPDGTTLVDVEAIDPSTLPPPPGGQALPVGVLSFEVQGMTPGGTVTVEVVTPADTAPDSYLKFQNGAWVDFTANSSFAGDIVTLSLTDGGAGDADGTANGVIVDPGAPTVASADAEGDEGDHGLRDVEVVAELASRTDLRKVRIDYCTADGSAGADADYRADCKHVNLNKHESSASIKLKIRGDQLVEGHEDFFVDLSTQGGTLVKDQFRIAIRDDD